jgi:ABC-type amino acid transport substrate-binding protein
LICIIFKKEEFIMEKSKYYVVTMILIFLLIFTLTGCSRGGDITPPITPYTHTITASTGSNGSIDSSGNVNVNEGSDKSFSIAPDADYQIDDVLVDGISVGAVSSYTFANVTEDHTISATFISEASASVYNLINGIDADFPPFTYIDNNDNSVGFDIDCVDWIAKEIGFEVKHIPISWDSIIAELLAGKIDLIASGMTIIYMGSGLEL